MASRGPKAVVSLSLSTPAPGSVVPRVPTWGEGEVPGACQLGCHSVSWGSGKGLPTLLSSEGIALPPNLPLPSKPPWLLPWALSPLPHVFTLLSSPACPDINECEEDGIECGPSQLCFNTRGSYQCVDTPCPATYRQGSSPG